MSDWPTTRKYPRTLREAFPHDREWAYSCEAPNRLTLRSIYRHALSVLAVLWLVVMVAHTLLEWAAQ